MRKPCDKPIVKVGINLDSSKGNIELKSKENKRNRPEKAQAFHF